MKKLAVMGLTVLPALFAALLPATAMGASTINAAGATFPNPIYQQWFGEYKMAHPDVQINYQSIGSGGGIQQLTEGTVDFGASDMPMTDEQIKGRLEYLEAFCHNVVKMEIEKVSQEKRNKGLKSNEAKDY